MFSDFEVIIYICIDKMFNFLKAINRTNYLLREVGLLPVRAINPYREPSLISFDSELMFLQLTEFEMKLHTSVVSIDIC